MQGYHKFEKCYFPQKLAKTDYMLITNTLSSNLEMFHVNFGWK